MPASGLCAAGEVGDEVRSGVWGGDPRVPSRAGAGTVALARLSLDA